MSTNHNTEEFEYIEKEGHITHSCVLHAYGDNDTVYNYKIMYEYDGSVSFWTLNGDLVNANEELLLQSLGFNAKIILDLMERAALSNHEFEEEEV